MIDPLIAFAVIAGLIVLSFARAAWRRAERGAPMIPRIPPDARFGEAGASGRTLGGWLARLGSANRCLLVYVDRGRLVVTLAFPYSLVAMPGLAALETDVPLAAIAAVTAGKRMGQSVLRIDFADRERTPIELIVEDEAGLVAALGLPAGGNRALRHRSLGTRIARLMPRAFLCLWGTFAAGFGGSGLIADLAMRDGAIAAQATVEWAGPKRALMHFDANGRSYTVRPGFTPLPGTGTITVYYPPEHPERAVVGEALIFETLFACLGTIALAFGIFGSRLVPGWQAPAR